MLDVVEFRQGGLAGKQAVVLVVRRLDDDTHLYELMSRDRDEADVGGVYEEDTLAATGHRASVADVTFLPVGFREGDVAVVAADYTEDDLAGRVVHLDFYAEEDDDGQLRVAVWCPELDGAFDVPPEALALTGDRVPPPPLGRRVESMSAGASFVVVDDVSHYRA